LSLHRLAIGRPLRLDALDAVQHALPLDRAVPVAVLTTLNLYTHIFQDADDQAAAALNATLSGGKTAS